MFQIEGDEDSVAVGHKQREEILVLGLASSVCTQLSSSLEVLLCEPLMNSVIDCCPDSKIITMKKPISILSLSFFPSLYPSRNHSLIFFHYLDAYHVNQTYCVCAHERGWRKRTTVWLLTTGDNTLCNISAYVPCNLLYFIYMYSNDSFVTKLRSADMIYTVQWTEQWIDLCTVTSQTLLLGRIVLYWSHKPESPLGV